MKRCYYLTLLLVPALLPIVGCAHAARDTAGFQMVDSETFEAPFMDTWQATKGVLREMDLHLYTRDKRGVFVAYTPMKRKLKLFTPKRTKYTITVEELPGSSTRVNIETVDQVYGVTPLTYPDWHDRKTADNKDALAILEALRAKLS